MAISLDLSDISASDLRFRVSPLVEFGSAWHVLSGIDHHPRRGDWAAGVRAVLPPETAAAMERWSFAVRAVRSTLFTDPELVPPGGWEEQLAWIRAMPIGEFTGSVLRPLLRERDRSADMADAGTRGRVVRLARARGPAVLELVRELLEDPEPVRRRFSDMLAAAWAAFFRAEWERALPTLNREVEVRSRRCARDGWAHALAGLSPAVRADAGQGRIVIDKVRSKRLVVAGRGVVLVPTAVGDGHVYVGDETGLPVVVHYPVPAPPRAADGTSTLRRLTALAHPSRLEVCRAIAVEPRSAREIAACGDSASRP